MNRVYAYTEAGSIEDTTYIYPLACIIRSIPKVLEQDVQNYYANTSSRAGNYFIYGPLLTTAWNQTFPYNYYAPECDWGNDVYNDYLYNGKYPVGCVAIATAQVIAYYEKFTGTMFGKEILISKL